MSRTEVRVEWMRAHAARTCAWKGRVAAEWSLGRSGERRGHHAHIRRQLAAQDP